MTEVGGLGGEGEHHHAPHREPGIDAHGYGAMIEIRSGRPIPQADVELLLKRLVTEIAERCLEAGARAIGHIKCHLRTGHGYAKADIVRLRDGAFAESRLDAPITGGSLVINSIVLGLGEEELERATNCAVSGLTVEHGFSLVKHEDNCQRRH